MTSVFEKMLAKKGLSPADVVNKNTRLGKLLHREGVPETAEVRRVRGLPRREPVELDAVALLTEHLRTEHGEETLRVSQAQALQEGADVCGLLAPMPVGEGKTLTVLLGAVLVGAQRPLMLVPGSLLDVQRCQACKRLRGTAPKNPKTNRMCKTHRDIERYAKHWRVGDLWFGAPIFSYQELGRDDRADWIEKVAPDYIGGDEVHKLKNIQAAVTRRVGRWMDDNMGTIFFGLSGTVTKRSLLDYQHLLLWALGPECMPLPETTKETMVWARAVDPGIELEDRLDPGALSCFMAPRNADIDLSFGPEIGRLREGLGLRIRQTIGVVAPPGLGCDASITLDVWEPELPVEVHEAIATVERTCIDPDGNEVILEEDRSSLIRQLACGFHYRWDPPPPQEWIEARKAWHRFVQTVLTSHLPGLDSELQVASQCAREREPPKAWVEWRRIRDTFRANPVPEWISTEVLDDIPEEWLKKPTILWAGYRAVGEHLAKQHNLRWFHQNGRDAKGLIDDAEGTVVCSIASNAEGRNLQKWHRGAVFNPMASGDGWEQLIGRKHRPGQDADNVWIAVMQATDGQRNALYAARREAEYLQQTTGQKQKLLLADWT